MYFFIQLESKAKQYFSRKIKYKNNSFICKIIDKAIYTCLIAIIRETQIKPRQIQKYLIEMQQPLILKPNISIFFYLKLPILQINLKICFRLKFHSIIKETSLMHIYILNLDYILMLIKKRRKSDDNLNFLNALKN